MKISNSTWLAFALCFLLHALKANYVSRIVFAALVVVGLLFGHFDL